MAFLDNSGDIILDAVLTDAGRKRLAAGDGSFRISKFALGDDEIDYSLYTPVTSSGYEDLRILQLPVFEAFTNNTSVLKNKLLTYADNSLLYLPVVKVNSFAAATGSAIGPTSGYSVAVDTTTVESVSNNGAIRAGYRFANDNANSQDSRVVFDQGLDTADLTLGYLASNQRNLVETQYIIEVDNRLLNLATTVDGDLATPTFIDDDSVASYYFSMNSNPGYFASQPNGTGQAETRATVAEYGWGNVDPATMAQKMIGPTPTTGRLGSSLAFALRATLDLQVNTSLFTQMGTEISFDPGDGVTSIYYTIDTVIRVTGFTTGYRTDVPLKLLKWKSTP